MQAQEYLQKNSLEKLTEEFGIKVKDYPDRIVLNYCQIDSSNHRFNPIVMECRNLILSKKDYSVMSRSFDRFYNLGEDPNTENFNITQATVFEKLDGSLMTVYHDGDKWNVCSRSMAYGEGETPSGKTFAEVFELCLGDTVNNHFRNFNKEDCYIFEMCSKFNRVVKAYTEDAIYLTGIRNKVTGQHEDIHAAYVNFPVVNWKYPEVYKFEYIDDIHTSFKDLPAMDEGYVCYIRKSNWRIKIKNPAYLAIAHLRDNGTVTPKRVVRLVMGNDHEEFLLYFPEYAEIFNKYVAAINSLKRDIESTYNDIKNLDNQKDFALKAIKHKFSGVLFNARKKHIDIVDAINEIDDMEFIGNLATDYLQDECNLDVL